MALTRPNRYVPDKASAGYSAINGRSTISSSYLSGIVSKDRTSFKTRSTTSSANPTTYISTPFTFSVGGNSPIHSFYITIYSMEGNLVVYQSETVVLNHTLYPVNSRGDEVRVKVYIPELDANGNPYIENMPWSNYKWTATVFWQEQSRNNPGTMELRSLTGPEAYFESRETLRVNKVAVYANKLSREIDYGKIPYQIIGETGNFPENVEFSVGGIDENSHTILSLSVSMRRSSAPLIPDDSNTIQVGDQEKAYFWIGPEDGEYYALVTFTNVKFTEEEWGEFYRVIDDGLFILDEYNFSKSYLKISTVSHIFGIDYTPVNVPISSFQWDLYDPNMSLIHSTGTINSPDVKFEYNGFLPISYTLRLTVTNVVNNRFVADIPLHNDEYNLLDPLDSQLFVDSLPLESCLHVMWDLNEIKDELVNKGYISEVSDLKGFEVYRRKKGDLFLKRLISLSSNAYEFYDYGVANNTEYAYYLYPVRKLLVDDEETRELLPVYVSTTSEDEHGFISEEYHKVSFDGWFLLVLTPNKSQQEGTYRVSKLFNWYADVTSGNISNNANISVNNNFGRYPRVQRARNNYLRIPLQGLAGYINCENNEYVDNQAIIDEIRELTTLDNVMVLKNAKGAVINVVPSTDVSFTLNEKVHQILTSMSVEFVEVGEVENISIINKVSNPRWMFTSTGLQPIGSPSVNLMGHRLRDNTILTPSNVTIE